MGNLISYVSHYTKYGSDVAPHGNSEPTFDPMYGFPNGRKERVMVATQDEMIANQIPLIQRDYCAHWLIRFLHCRNDYEPFVIMCSYQRHQYDKCQHDDYVMRMKEYERERRLRMRQKRKKMKEEQQALVA